MGAALIIARRDLMSFFTSIKGASIFFFFLIFMGVFFQNFVATFAELTAQAPQHGGEAPTLEQLTRAIFYNLHFILILIVPAVTMSAFSEEKRNHAFRLLQTSPVTSLQIVLGKFLASTSLLGFVLLASTVYPMFTVLYGNPDVGVILSSYLGIFLLMCGQVAFGIWISSMTSNQFIAFLFTMFGIFMLMILNWLAPHITGGGTLENVAKYVASTEHLDSFFKGLITVKSTMYFLCFSAMFLFFTNVALDSQRWR